MGEMDDKPYLFIGSTKEGLDIAAALQLEAERFCLVERWDQRTFSASGITLQSLIDKAESSDFAVLVATPDDVTSSRGVEGASVRDNIIFEFGLFTGALGLDRTYLLAPGTPKLPSDLQGLTRLSYAPRSDGNERAAVTGAALDIKERVDAMGKRESGIRRVARDSSSAALQAEKSLLIRSALSQGWSVKSDSDTTLRLVSPHKSTHTMKKGSAGKTRTKLRKFASELKAHGLRLDSVLTAPESESPF
ncbi:nucleotide-binding protein [Brevibacterium sp. CBA3109]|uniref:Nucleotide-binding protein n=1 Tax=Brevibacterium koreense TaxID=3140787 RepID=A0AAU7UIE5_9MICO